MCPHGPTRTSRRGEDVRMSAPGLGHRPARELCGEIVPAVAAALPAPAAVVVDDDVARLAVPSCPRSTGGTHEHRFHFFLRWPSQGPTHHAAQVYRGLPRWSVSNTECIVGKHVQSSAASGTCRDIDVRGQPLLATDILCLSQCPSVGVVTAIGLLGLALQASYQRGLVPAVLVSAALAPLMNAKQATESDAESQLQAAERLHVASSSATSKLELPCCDKSFDAKSIYGAGEAALDMDHPNRIDQYGSLFQDDEFSSHPGLLSKVKKLKNSLIRLARLQKHLASQLDKPVQVSETVLPGAPGRMGRRGRRGPVGRRGKPGMTGAQVLSLCCTPLTCYTALDTTGACLNHVSQLESHHMTKYYR